MLNLSNRILRHQYFSIWIFVCGVGLQGVFFSMLSSIHPSHKLLVSIYDAIINIWFYIPLISIIAIFIAIIQIRTSGKRAERYLIPLIGLIINILWLLFSLFIIYIIYAIGMPF